MSEKTLSVFVDESGILNESDMFSRYYIIALILHDQSFDIAESVNALDRELATCNIVNLCFHAAPIIRGNGMFSILDANLRRRIFSRMMGFARRIDFRYHCLSVDKHYCDTTDQILNRLGHQIDEFMGKNMSYFSDFSKIKVYYDCGQPPITNFLHSHFVRTNIPPVEFAQSVQPRNYKLFQVADLICTLRLLELKLEIEGRLSPSEFRFFGGIKAFRHNILRQIRCKEI